MGFTTARRPNDLVIEYEGLTVLVDPRSLEILDGTVVDYERVFSEPASSSRTRA